MTTCFATFVAAQNNIHTGQEASLSYGLDLEGNFQQGGLLWGRVSEGEAIFYKGKPLFLDAEHRFIIGLDRDADTSLELQVVNQQGSKRQHVYQIEKRQYDIQHIEGVAKKYVAPDPKQVSRSRKEGAKVRMARSQIREQSQFFTGFQWPVNGPITGVFGSQRVYNGEPRRPHYGVDVARPVGTPVGAPAAGVITLAEPDLFFSGGTLIIDHGHGLSSTFLHLSRILVPVGQVVQQGQYVGEIGATGRVTGAHLDWRMNWNAMGNNVRIDPQLLVPEMSSRQDSEH